MIVWDTGGFYFNEACGEASLERGKLDFVLDGFKAKGRFALIATGRRKAATGLAGTQGAAAEWLLIKKKDAHSKEGQSLTEAHPRSVYSGLRVEELDRREEIGRALERAAEAQVKALGAPARKKRSEALIPMVCDSSGAPQSSPDWLYELKLDGVRILATKKGEEVQLQYRSGRTTTKNYADIQRAMRHLPVGDLLLDGEIVTFDERGRPNFARLAPRIQARKAADIARVEAEVPVIYMIFDVLRIGNVDVRGLPVESRKALVKQLVQGQGYLRALDHIVEKGEALFALCEQEELEGMVAKRLGSTYSMGPQASGHWVKIKRQEDHEFVVIGYTLGEENGLKALCLGAYVGDRLIYRGRVGGGFSNKQRQALLADLEKRTSESESGVIPNDVPARSVHPQLVVKVRCHGFTEDGHLRAPVYLGVHEYADPHSCTAGPNDEYAESPPSPEERGGDQEEVPPQQNTKQRRARLTNLNKIFWPDEGLTKGDLLAYYEGIAPFMLPHLEDRPVVLVRYPDGIAGKSFYQWRSSSLNSSPRKNST
jgi:bifunctional non-homologous end joining protein LigD